MPAVQPGIGRQGPTCWDRVKLGFMMGFSVGVSVGVLFGGVQAFRMGYRGRELLQTVGYRCRELLQTVGKSSVQGGGTFGTFMAVGSAIRMGYRGRELLQTVGKSSVQGGGTFGTFMAVGSAIRC